jgi:hypothetical protein
MKKQRFKTDNPITSYIVAQKNFWKQQISLFRRENFPPFSQDLKWRFRLCDELAIVEDLKQRAADQQLFKQYSIQISKTYLLSARLRAIRAFLYELSSLLFIFLVGFLYYRFLGNPNQVSFSPGTYLIQFGPEILLLLFLWVCSDMVLAKLSVRDRLIIILAILFISSLYLTVLKTKYTALAFGVAGIFSILAVSIAVDAFIFTVTEYYADHRYPEALVIHNLLLILSKIESNSDLPASLDFKVRCPVRLEFAALAFEKHLYARLKTHDRNFNDWFQERCAQIACALREKKKWVLTPKPDTPKWLAQSLAEFVIHFMHNEWDLLDRMELPKKSLKDKFLDRTWIIVRTLVVGFLPITVLFLLQDRQIIPVNNNLIGITLTWAVVNLLWVDPTTKEKISAMKDLTGMMQPKS